LYLVFFKKNDIRIEPTNPAPPVITIIFFIL